MNRKLSTMNVVKNRVIKSGSGRVEKAVDLVIVNRQKRKGMSWSSLGSKALAILKVLELNGEWQQFWFPETII